MQHDDGNLVVYHGGTPLWSSGGQWGAGTRAVMQTDGNLVLYHGSLAKWASASDEFGGADLRLGNDGNVVIVHQGRPVWSWMGGYVGHELQAGQELSPGGLLRSPNSEFRLVMQPSDGNLVLYRGQTAVWATGAAGAGARAVMQRDGNFVIYDGWTPKWHSHTAGFPGAALVVQDDSNVVGYHSGHAIWARDPGYIGDRLPSGTGLLPGAYLRSPNGQYQLIMQSDDGNLVMYGPAGPVWAYDTAGHPGARAEMQTDGNFVVYSGYTPVRWTGTGQPGAYFRLQDDANVVVYHDFTALWSRFTGPIGPSAPQPGPGSGPANAAASWGAARVGERYASGAVAALFNDWAPGPYGEWSGDCAKFAFAAWRAAGVTIARGNARQQYEAYKSRVQGGAPPRGALVFWPNVAPPYGHIAIADGVGGVYTTQGMDFANLPVAHVPASRFGAPAGWAMP